MKLTKILVILTTIFVSSCSSFKNNESLGVAGDKNSSVRLKDNSKNSDDVDKIIIATYNGGEVSLKQAQIELNKLILKNPKLKGLNFNNLKSEQQQMIIKEIIIRDLSYIQARKHKLHKTKEYKEAIQLFQTEFLKQQLFLKIANDAKQEENLKENYDKLASELKNKNDIRISYIALKTKSDADSLYKTLKRYPKSFSKQAKKKSIDKDVAKKGGDLGFVLETVLPQEIGQQVKKLQKNQISKPFPLADKWLIVKLVDQRKAQIAKFEDSKDALAQSLSMKALQDFISNSLKEADMSVKVQ